MILIYYAVRLLIDTVIFYFCQYSTYPHPSPSPSPSPSSSPSPSPSPSPLRRRSKQYLYLQTKKNNLAKKYYSTLLIINSYPINISYDAYLIKLSWVFLTWDQRGIMLLWIWDQRGIIFILNMKSIRNHICFNKNNLSNFQIHLDKD